MIISGLMSFPGAWDMTSERVIEGRSDFGIRTGQFLRHWGYGDEEMM